MIFLIIAGVLVVVGAVIFVVVMSLNDWDFKKLGTVKYETNTYVIEEDFSKIIITTTTADIEFLPSSDGKCKVVCYEEEKIKHEVKAEGGKLVIDVKDSRKWYDYINFSFDSPKITVYLPVDIFCSLNISSSTGNITIPNAFTFDNISIAASTADVGCYASATGEIRIEVSTGNIDVTGVRADSLHLVASTGKIKVKMVACSGDISTKTSTGETTIMATDCKNFYSNGDTGDIKMVGVIASGIFNIERSTGDIEFENCDANEIYAKTSTGDIEGSLLSEKVFFAETDTGDVDVPKTITGGRCELTTSTGDIEITIQ